MKPSLQLFLDELTVRFVEFKNNRYDARVWSIEPRVLQHSVLWYVSEGAATIHVDGAPFSVQPYRFYCIPEQSELSCKVHSDYISIQSVNFDARFSFLPHRVWTSILHIPVDYPFEAKPLADVYGEFRKLAEHHHLTQRLRQHAETGKLVSLMIDQMEEQGDLQLRSFIQEPRIHAVIDYLSSHTGDMPDMKRLSALVQLSESQLRKLFYQYTGLSPIHYIHQLKMNLAIQLLTGTTERISEIAYRLGFTDPNYFSRLFKKITGLAPQQYRDRV